VVCYFSSNSTSSSREVKRGARASATRVGVTQKRQKLSRVTGGCSQDLPLSDAFVEVELEKPGRRFPFASQRLDDRASQYEGTDVPPCLRLMTWSIWCGE
jgi:hypothetical protein